MMYALLAVEQEAPPLPMNWPKKDTLLSFWKKGHGIKKKISAKMNLPAVVEVYIHQIYGMNDM